MSGKKWIFALASLLLASLACNYIMGTPTPQAPPTEAPVTEVAPPTRQPQTQSTTEILQQLGGQPCAEQPDMTCVTLTVPLDHFDSANSETLQVVFAVLPATGERYGMYVQAFPGGPGGEGISSAYPGYFADSILAHFDIVYFDQRGLGLSSPLSCPKTYAADFLNYLNSDDTAGAEGLDTKPEQDEAVQDAKTYAENCVAEIGIEPAKLAFYGTNQVAEDIESFRQAMGDDKFWLYGVSYGTAVGQTYAAAHPEHLAGLILDGTIDLTLSGEQGAYSQEKGFDTVLVATLKACDADPDCAQELGGDAVAVYDKLAEKISKKPIAYEYPLPSGEKVKRTFTFNQLEYTAAYQMYSLGSRSLFLRALAAADKGDIVPMARLLYKQATVDPATGEYIGDPTFSDTMFLSVHCTDNSYFSGTPEERIAKAIEAGQASNGTVPRLDGNVYTTISCAFWPSTPKEPAATAPLSAPGVPTLVLNATLDPATPFDEGKTVFGRLDNGYHIYVEGGVHSIYGWGEACPDDYVTNFLVEGKLPAERETVCQWDPGVIYSYIPLIAPEVSDFETPLDVFLSITDELIRIPEYYYSDFEKEESFACPKGGSFTFGPSDSGETYSFEKCAFTKGFEMTGTGSYNSDSQIISFEAEITGSKTGTLNYSYSWADGSASVSGEYGGETIDLKR